ncbi:chromate transporter [Brevundimonas sp. Leaf363]|nr:chromate transporter [Brevundimonas sp. Leaf363]
MTYGALFLRFLKFGLMAFGGPVAQIGMIRRELVDEERWISSAGFNRLLAVMQVLPGPEAHELCVHLGVRAKGRLGGLLAGLGFMLPGFVLMLAVAAAYVAFAPSRDLLAGAFLGVQIAVLALIARAVQRIGGHILEDRALWALALAAGAASLAGVSFWISLAAGAVLYPLVRARRWAFVALVALAVVALAVGLRLAAGPGGGVVAGVGAMAAPGAVVLFWTGLKAGLLTFGGAYTAIPYVRADTVGRGWIADDVFLDGVAFAGVLPAPLVIFCTFAGYVAGGWAGAVAITAGVFLPAFAFSMIFYERLEKLVETPRLHDVLTGVAAAAVGVIGATALQLAWATARRTPGEPVAVACGLAIFALALTVATRWKSPFNAPLVLLAAGLVGYVAF